MPQVRPLNPDNLPPDEYKISDLLADLIHNALARGGDINQLNTVFTQIRNGPPTFMCVMYLMMLDMRGQQDAIASELTELIGRYRAEHSSHQETQ